MLNTIFGAKKRMSQAFIQGRRVPVTQVQVTPCVVTQVKTVEKDGYWALQVGFGIKRVKNTTKALQGHLKKSTNREIYKSTNSPRFLREIRLKEKPEVSVGETVAASDIFSLGDYVAVSGVSKGKGFAGVVKRWHFAGGPRTHGQSDRERAPGSIGSTTTPGRVFKGKKMAGRMGGATKTVKNLQVVKVDPSTNTILLSGPVPGTRGSIVSLTKLSGGKLEGIHEVVAQVQEGEEAPGEKTGEMGTEETVKKEEQVQTQ